jgi:hypothetical protein
VGAVWMKKRLLILELVASGQMLLDEARRRLAEILQRSRRGRILALIERAEREAARCQTTPLLTTRDLEIIRAAYLRHGQSPEEAAEVLETIVSASVTRRCSSSRITSIWSMVGPLPRAAGQGDRSQKPLSAATAATSSRIMDAVAASSVEEPSASARATASSAAPRVHPTRACR